MKIALITYHHSCNNGAVMQTYALMRYLSELGHNVEIIDLRQDESGNNSMLVRIVKYFIFGFRIGQIRRKYYKNFSKRYYSVQALKEDPPKADCYMVGSDQVWNTDISKEVAIAYFLNFGKEDIKRISYASSFGVSEWNIIDGKFTSEVKRLLKRFDSISVREEEGRAICNNVFDVDPTVVLDPTFLNYGYPEFNGKCKDEEEFVCYKLNRTQDFWDNTPIIGDLIGIKPTMLNYNYPKRNFKYCFPPSLRTWMQKLASAKFILTDSFHGIAFSIINRRQFVAILNNNGKDSRLINLLKKMGLSNRLYPSVEAMIGNKEWMEPIDYSIVEPLISEEIRKSRDFLIKALSK